MNKQRKLIWQRSLFFFIVSILFAIIIINEKADTIFLPKVQKKFDNYINTNYNSISKGITINKPTYKNMTFKSKVISKENKNHYFYLYYSNHKVTDSYQKDYVKGKKLLTHIKQSLKKEIEEKTNIKCNIIIPTTLDKYTEQVRERIIKEEKLSELKFYIIDNETTINNWTSAEITKYIVDILVLFKKESVTPKYFNITITDKNDITKSVKISNITQEFITNPNKEQIINDILNDNNSKILNDNKITYQFLN